MHRLATRWPAFVLVAALLFAGCGGSGGGDPGADGATPDAAAGGGLATATAAAPSTGVATASPRPDGVSGAPVPLPSAASAAFDATLLNVNAGSFPPLDYPPLATAEEATWLDDDALVLGAVQNGEARAYPLSMMRLHHVANDSLGGEPYLVTF